MTRYNSLLIIAPLIFTIFWLMSLVTIHQKEITAFNSWVLQKQVNYAADAAVEELRLYSENANLDYMSRTINIDSSYAIDEFESILCKELGYEPTKEYKDFVGRNYIKVLLLCTENGFYPYLWQPVRYADYKTKDPEEIDLNQAEAATDTTHTGVRKVYDETADYAKVSEFISYPLMPYSGEFNIDLLPDGSKEKELLQPGRKYAVTLTCDKIYHCEYADNPSDESNPIIQGVTTLKDENLQEVKPSEGTVLQMRGIINASVETFLRSAIYSAYNNEQPSTVILPSGIDTIHGGQGILGPCVLAIVDTSQSNNIYNASFGIGGATVQETDYILAWKNTAGGTNNRYWVSTSMLKNAGFDIQNGTLVMRDGSDIPEYLVEDLQGIENAKVYNSPFKAAEAGYNEYWGIMGNQKWID